ncbi:MAG: 30S ribosomal protein S15 [Planctomycetes bacterium]|nr:30S ribosomal protein S15 [Planctomycetota bacterium]
MTIAAETKKQIISDNKRHEKDSGSPEVQVAVLTAQIQDLTQHMQRHPKDYHSRHGLLLKVNRRNKLMAYLRRVDSKKHAQLAEKLGLRK